MLMAPFGLKLSLPVALILCTAWLCYRYTWKRHPGMLSCFLLTTGCYVTQMVASNFRFYSIPIQLAAATGMVLEVLTFRRLNPSARVRNLAIGATTILCGALASIPRGLTMFERVSLFRSDYLVAVATVAVGAFVYRLFRPLSSTCISINRVRTAHPECFRHKALGAGVAAWTLVYAISGSFCSGGLGYLMFPYTQRTFYAVEYATLVSLIFVVGALTLMVAPVPGRKHAAKDTRGRTRTGLIETREAA